MARTSVTGAGNWWSPTTGLSLDSAIVKDINGTTIGGSTGTSTVYIATTGGVYKGVKTEFTAATESNDKGSFTFSGLEADTYYITAMKNGYKSSTQKVKLKKDEVKKNLQIKLKKKKK